MTKLKAFFKSLALPFFVIGAVLIGLIAFLRHLFGGEGPAQEEFPQKQKKELKKEIKDLEKEEKSIKKAKFTDEELDEIFNGKDKDKKTH